MPAIGYQTRFVADVKSGKKRQTIRPMRKRPFRIGDTLYHYADWRRPTCKKIRTDKCRMVVDISILRLPDSCDIIVIGGRTLLEAEALAFARADGFETVDDLMAWFLATKHGSFYGQVILW